MTLGATSSARHCLSEAKIDCELKLQGSRIVQAGEPLVSKISGMSDGRSSEVIRQHGAKERHALRQDVIDRVGSIFLLRPCHGEDEVLRLRVAESFCVLVKLG